MAIPARAVATTALTALAVTWCRSAGASGVQLLAADFDSGDLFRVSALDASASFAASTGLPGLGALELAPDGFLYGFTTGDAPNPGWYRFDPTTLSPTRVGDLDIGLVFEGGLAFAPNGTLYGANQNEDDAAGLFSIDPDTGQANLIGTISGGPRDINGLAWRGDGALIGLDRISNALLAIDPITALATPIIQIAPAVGTVGGMAVLDDTAYFVTSGPGEPVPGSNELYRVDLFTGAYDRVGSLSPSITGTGVGGLAVPEPGTCFLLLGLTAAMCRRRRSASSR